MNRASFSRLIVLICVAFSLYVNPASAQSELDGAWEVTEAKSDWSGTVENVQPGLYIFHGGYYSVLHVWDNEPRPLYEEDESRDTVSHEKLLSIVVGIEGNSGRYVVDGSTVTLSPMVAIDPNYMMGETRSYVFELDGDELILTDDSNGRVLKFRRLN